MSRRHERLFPVLKIHKNYIEIALQMPMILTVEVSDLWSTVVEDVWFPVWQKTNKNKNF